MIIPVVPRVIAGVCAIPIGGLCVVGAFESGVAQAGHLAGAAFGAIVISVWFIPAIIRTATWDMAVLGRVLLLIGAAFGMVNAIGYAASHRSAGVSSAQNAIESYDRAVEAHKASTADLEAVRRHPKKPGEDHPLWVRSGGCANATLPESQAYCAEVARIRAVIDSAQSKLNQGRPLAADPQAESVSVFTGIEPAAFNRWWPIVIAMVAELFATGLMTLAFAPIPIVAVAQSKPDQKIEVVEVEVVEREPEWLTVEAPQPLAFPRQNPKAPQLSPMYRADGRTLRALKRRAANDDT